MTTHEPKQAPTARLNSLFPWLNDVLENNQIVYLCDEAERHIDQCYEWETDLKAMLRELLDYFRPQQSPDRTESNGEGHVCLVRCEDSGLFNVAGARHMPTFIKALLLTPPFDYRLIHTIATPDMQTLEKELRGRYDGQRKIGEWFALESDDVEYIKGL